VLVGEWQYMAGCDRVAVLPKPSMKLSEMKANKLGHVLEEKEVVLVKERVRPLNGKGSFLRLADGRGWVLDFANGRQVVQRWQAPSDSASTTDGGAASSLDTLADVVGLASQELGEPEVGAWDYIVLDTKGICLRNAPTYDKTSKMQHRLEEGELVSVKERRAGNGTTFLHLDGPQGYQNMHMNQVVALIQGWVFDLQPGSQNKRQRLAQVEVQSGAWFYRVCAHKGIALRSRCTFSLDAKVGQGPNEGALVSISRRVKVGKTTFLKPKDENGWIFDAKNGKTMVEGPLDVEEPLDAIGTLIGNENIYLLSAPTTLTWAITKKLLLPGACGKVTHICVIDGTRWAHFAQSGSMCGWVRYDLLSLGRKEEDSNATHSNSFDAQRVRAALEAPMPRQF